MNPPRLHVVALSHLDTQWRWTVRDTVERFLPATVRENEMLFERFPRYVLSFEGSWRYRLLAEHHPELFALVRRRVAEGRWHPAGAAVEAFDTLLPAPESIVRQILYGRRWFRRELGIDSSDLFLPDCFGFPITLPTLAAHLRIAGFSTQKLRRGQQMRSAVGIPFRYGRWLGVDGSELLAALDPGEYSARIDGDLTQDEEQVSRARRAADAGQPAIGLLYVGVGDRGGAVPSTTVEHLTAALDADGPLTVRHGASERIYLETTEDERAALPAYSGELLLRLHGTGCYTAKAALKRWNRRVEGLARLAETAVVAALAAGFDVPRRRLEAAWELLLAHQMHDDLTGTSIPAAYDFTFADLGLAANELEEIALDAAGRAVEALDRSGDEPQLVVLSTAATPHEDVVEVIDVPADSAVVVDADGVERPIQRGTAESGERGTLVPVASRGAELQILRLRAASTAPAVPAAVRTGELWIENERYRLELDENGAVRSLEDKRLRRELLAAAPSLDLLPDRSAKYPAWEILWRDASSAPEAGVDRLVAIDLLERGPLRATLRVVRSARGVVVREAWSLSAGGAGELAVADVEIDWHRRASLLKATWRLAAGNPLASFDTGLGSVTRPIADEGLYEVPAQQWAAIEDAADGHAVALFSDCRHGWDHPDAHTLRSSWIHAPRASLKWRHQATQDFGRHRLRFAVAGFAAGELSAGHAGRLADRFAHRPRVYRLLTSESSPEPAPRRKLLVALRPPARLLALKPAEDRDAVVVRLANCGSSSLRPELASDLVALGDLHVVDGLEQTDPSATDREPEVPSGGLASRRSAPLERSRASVDATPLPLPWREQGCSRNGERRDGGGFDGRGHFLPLELMPATIEEDVVPFDLRHLSANGGDVLAANGELLELPESCREVWLLGASVDGELDAVFAIDDRPLRRSIPDWRAPLLRESRFRRRPFGFRLAPGLFRRASTAWSCGHLHDRDGGDLAVDRAVLYAVQLPVLGARSLRLPRLPSLRLVAATWAGRPARRLADAQPPFPP